MKVKIGPHKDWIGPYQIAEALCFWAKKEKDEHGFSHKPRWVHEFGNFLAGKDKDSWLTILCNWIHSKKERKIKIRIDNYDTWNMDATLAYIILPMLKQLKETKHGSPGDMPAFNQTSNSAQYSFDFYAEDDDKAWEVGHEQWCEILDKIIWAFEQYNTDWEDQYWITKPEMDLSDHPEDEGKDATPVRWKVKGVCDWEGHQKHQDRIQEGLELFGKYYQGLWD